MVRVPCLHSDVALGYCAIDCLWLTPTSGDRLFMKPMKVAMSARPLMVSMGHLLSHQA